MVSNGDRAELVSWKEIAAYLGVGVRTAQVWEAQRGLPVRRLPGPRGQVTALIADLDTWKASANLPPSLEPRARVQWRWMVGGVLLGTLLIGGVLITRRGAPSGYRIEHQDFVVVDARGREVWRKSFPSLTPDAYVGSEQSVWIGDLGDGTISVVFAPRTDAGAPAQPLICYTKEGHERWRFTPGRSVRTRIEKFVPPFRVRQVLVLPEHRIVVVSTHHLEYPCQVALLTPDGRLEREYWHSGQLTYAVTGTMSGQQRIILGGVSNGAHTATIVALDPTTMTGASQEQNPDYQLQDFPRGVEAARLLFPRSTMNEKLEPFATMTGFVQLPDELTVEVSHRLAPTRATVYYHLNRDLTLRSLSVGAAYTHEHLQLEANGALTRRLDERETNALHAITYVKGPLQRAP